MKFFFLLPFLFPILSQALEVKANVDKNELSVNETLVFTISIQSNKEDSKNWSIPNIQFNDFHSLGQWSGQESSMQIINGKMEQTNVFSKSYRLQPKTTGTLRIESLTVKTYDKTFTTDPIFITVNKENKKPSISTSPSNPPQHPLWKLPDPFQSPHNLFDMFTNPFSSQNKIKNDIKFQLNLYKKSVYRAEMIRADWFVLQSSGSIRYNPHKTPILKGFWKEEIKNRTPSSSAKTVVIDKVLYRKTPFNSYWLFPLQTGKLTVDPYSIRINHFFGFRSSEEIKSSPTKTITVKDLPPHNLNVSWTGAVGSFEVHAEVKEKTITANQPISYTITFKGLGHPRFITLPPLHFPSSFQTYPPVEKSLFSDLGIGTKEFEILVVPKQKGVLHTPSFTLSTFNPQKDKYILHKIPSFSLMVKKGKPDEESKQSFFEEETNREQHSFSMEPLNIFFWPQSITHNNITKLWLILFIIFLIGLLFVYIKNFTFKKEKSLEEKISQKFSNIQKLLNKKSWQKACIQMIQINNFILDTAQIKGSFSGWRQALNNLSPSLNKKYSSQFENLFKNLEDLSFSQNSYSDKEALDKAKSLFQKTKTLINSLLSDL